MGIRRGADFPHPGQGFGSLCLDTGADPSNCTPQPHWYSYIGTRQASDHVITSNVLLRPEKNGSDTICNPRLSTILMLFWACAI